MSQLSISQLDDRTHLHGQTDGVEKDEGEHQVLKVGGVDHVPHLVLVRILGDVATQRACLQSILHTLTLSHTHRQEHESRLELWLHSISSLFVSNSACQLDGSGWLIHLADLS